MPAIVNSLLLLSFKHNRTMPDFPHCLPKHVLQIQTCKDSEAVMLPAECVHYLCSWSRFIVRLVGIVGI